MTLSFVYIVFCLRHIIFHFARIDVKATYTSQLGYVHSILDIFSWRRENLASSIELTLTAPFGTCRSHTSNKSVGAVNRDVWCTKFPSSFLNTVFTSVSVASSPPSFLLTSATGQIGVHTALLSMAQTEQIFDSQRSRSASRSFALSQKSRRHNLSCV